MPKGNSKAYLNSPIADNTEIDYETNKVMIEHCLDIFHHKEPDLTDPEDVEKTISYYFDSCISRGLRPGNMGLYTSLGLTRKEVKDLIDGRLKSIRGVKVNPGVLPHLKKAQRAMALFRESLGAQGKLNPATLIFWQKNFDGLEDVQRVELDANTAPTADKSPDEIAKMIEQDIPIDSTYTEIQ